MPNTSTAIYAKSPLMRHARRLVFALIATILALASLEILARTFLFIGLHALLPPDVAIWITSKQVVFDAELGWRPAGGFPSVEGGNFKNDVFNQDKSPRLPGELRGYAFGDSQTHGAGIAEDHAWPSVVERLLRAEGFNIHVINLASSGYRSAQVLRLLEAYVIPHQPDFLLVDCMINDSEPLPRRYGEQWTTLRPLLFKSRLYRLMTLGIAKAKGQNTGPITSITIEQPPAGTQGAGNHQSIANLARVSNIPVIFVDYPVTGTPIHSLAPASYLPPGATVVEATAALLATQRPATDLFLENNHLSVEGSEVVGKAVADTLRTHLPPMH
jgi:lysophospholipase L1-like esterase